MAETIEVVVYPRLVPLKSPALPRRDFFGIPGAESPVEDPVYILGTRDYQHGRPAKYIHWKATARHHKLQEKIFEPTEQEKILLVVDVGQFAQHGAEEAFERVLETVASVAVLLDERGCSVGLVTNGRMTGGGPPIVPVTRNPQQLAALLEALARLRMEPARDLIDMMRLHLRLPWGISCLYFALEKDGTARLAREYFTQDGCPFCFLPAIPFPLPQKPALHGGPAARGPDDNRAGEGLELMEGRKSMLWYLVTGAMELSWFLGWAMFFSLMIHASPFPFFRDHRCFCPGRIRHPCLDGKGMADRKFLGLQIFGFIVRGADDDPPALLRLVCAPGRSAGSPCFSMVRGV